MQFKLEYKFSTMKLGYFGPLLISDKLILNEIIWFESGIWSTVAPT